MLMLAGGGLTVTALRAAPQLAGPALLATTSASVAFLGLQVAFDRREEITADLFAVALTRDLEAAAELMGFYEENVAKPLPAGRLGRASAQLERRWFATHPDPRSRLAAMRRHLVDHTPDVVVNVVAASNLERNLYLTTELIDMDCTMVMALNMYDELEHSGSSLDYDLLGTMLGRS